MMLSAEDTLCETARFAATHARLYPDMPESAQWLVTAAVLLAQQSAAMALNMAGSGVPAQSGATEMLLRAATPKQLPAPFTLSFPASKRAAFDRLVEARNAFMHPRGASWFASVQTLSYGLPVVCATVRHLMLVQPVVPDMVSPRNAESLHGHLDDVQALADFLAEQE